MNLKRVAGDRNGKPPAQDRRRNFQGEDKPDRGDVPCLQDATRGIIRCSLGLGSARVLGLELPGTRSRAGDDW